MVTLVPCPHRAISGGNKCFVVLCLFTCFDFKTWKEFDSKLFSKIKINLCKTKSRNWLLPISDLIKKNRRNYRRPAVQCSDATLYSVRSLQAHWHCIPLKIVLSFPIAFHTSNCCLILWLAKLSMFLIAIFKPSTNVLVM